MATIDMRYDHPQYLVRLTGGGEVAAAASSRFTFTAFTTALLKSVQLGCVIALGTTNTYVVSRISQAGTSTTAIATATFTAGNMAQRSNITSTHVLSQGDSVTVVKGSTDGVGIVGVGVELAVVPGATVTA